MTRNTNTDGHALIAALRRAWRRFHWALWDAAAPQGIARPRTFTARSARSMTTGLNREEHAK